MALHMNALDVTWGRTVKVWWAIVWRATIFGMIVGAILGAIGGVVTAVTGKGNPSTVGSILGWLGAIPVSILALRQVLRKQFRAFSIQLIERSEA